MTAKPYLMVLSYRGSFEAHGDEIKRIGYLVEGIEMGPVMVLGDGAVIALITEHPPRAVHDAVRTVVGDRPEIVIAELGPAWSGSGAPEMEGWLDAHLATVADAEAP